MRGGLNPEFVLRLLRYDSNANLMSVFLYSLSVVQTAWKWIVIFGGLLKNGTFKQYSVQVTVCTLSQLGLWIIIKLWWLSKFLLFRIQICLLEYLVADVPDVENLDLILRERTVAKVIILYYIVSKLKKKNENKINTWTF